MILWLFDAKHDVVCYDFRFVVDVKFSSESEGWEDQNQAAAGLVCAKAETLPKKVGFGVNNSMGGNDSIAQQAT